MSTTRRRGVRRAVLVAVGPVVAVTAGVFTNLITTHWSWWIFSALVALAAVLAAVAVLSTRPEESSAEHSGFMQDTPRRSNMLLAPEGTPTFCGRTGELAQLVGAAGMREHRPRRLVISGIAGVGKTELAIRAAQNLTSSYPDGVFWIGLRTYAVAAESQLEVTQALRMLLSAINENPDPTATSETDLVAAWRAASAGLRILLIMDDADRPEQVKSLMPSGANSAVLITSRHVLPGVDPDCCVDLQPFDRAGARQLAEAILGRVSLADRATVNAIAARYQLPLALRHICNLRIGNPGVGISDLLMSSTAGIGDGTAALQLSLDALTVTARQLLRKMSRYPGSNTTAAIAATLMDEPLQCATKLLAELYQHGLLSFDSVRGYRMHDIVRDAAFHEAAAEMSGRETTSTDSRIFRYIGAAIGSAVEMLYPGPFYGKAQPPSIAPPSHPDDQAALTWLDLYYADLLAVSRHAMATSYPQAWFVIYAFEYYQRIRGFYPESIELEKQALSIAENQNDRLGQASMHQNLGITYTRTDEHDLARANLETALSIYESLGEMPGLAMANNELAKLYTIKEDLASARVHAETALILFRDIGQPADIGSAQRQVGILDRLEESFGSARANFNTAERLYEGIGQRRGIASCHRELGLLDHETNQPGDARNHFQFAMSLYQALEDEAYMAETHQGIAALDLDARKLQSARRHLETALKINKHINNRRGQAGVYVELGKLARVKGDEASAKRLWNEAISIYAQLNLQVKADRVRYQLKVKPSWVKSKARRFVWIFHASIRW